MGAMICAHGVPQPATRSNCRWLPPVKGLSMASFNTPGHVVYIVSDLPDPAFHQVAESLVESRIAALVLAIQSDEIRSRRE